MPSDNWVSPIDYSNATFYLSFEVVNQPTTTPFKIQLGIWQDSFLGSTHRETVSGQYQVSGGNGSSINVSLGQPSGWWNIPSAPGPVDFTRPEDFYRIGLVLWTTNGCIPISAEWGSSAACPNSEAEAAKFFPMTAKVRVKAVYSGGTTSYLNVSPSDKTVSTSSGSTTFAVSSNVDWTVSESSSWLTATKTNATTLTVNYDVNSGAQRQAAITLSGPGVSNKTVTLTQDAGCTVPSNPVITAADGSPAAM
jgi:hypothetical protein